MPEMTKYLDRNGLDWTIWAFYDASGPGGKPEIIAKAKNPKNPLGWFQYRAAYVHDAPPEQMWQMAVNDLNSIEWRSHR